MIQKIFLLIIVSGSLLPKYSLADSNDYEIISSYFWGLPVDSNVSYIDSIIRKNSIFSPKIFHFKEGLNDYSVNVKPEPEIDSIILRMGYWEIPIDTIIGKMNATVSCEQSLIQKIYFNDRNKAISYYDQLKKEFNKLTLQSEYPNGRYYAAFSLKIDNYPHLEARLIHLRLENKNIILVYRKVLSPEFLENHSNAED